MDGRTVVSKNGRASVAADFYRVVGGTVNFFETTEKGIQREIKEEFGTEIENLQLLEVAENLYPFDNIKRHAIEFLYKGELKNKELLKTGTIHVVDDGYEVDAVWVPIEELLHGPIPLYPKEYKKYLG